MIHYTCDFCSHPIRREDLRFEVRIEVRVACEPVDEVGFAPELLDEDPADFLDLVENDAYRVFRFDICTDCQAAFFSDPPSRPRGVGLKYFEN